MIENKFDEFISNLTEILNYSSHFEIVEDKSKKNLASLMEGEFHQIKIPVASNLDSLSVYLEKENIELLNFYIKEFLIFNKTRGYYSEYNSFIFRAPLA